MSTKHAAAALGFAVVAAWIALGFGSAVLCLLGAAAGWAVAALATGELEPDELRARLDGARAGFQQPRSRP
ncbi:MAG: hypothetical protein MSC31_08125 [Solirubrobacteraceae bacterium MAG38_C4-C5]|nr:hypothetical protein [Candidatus Siliceabacter maunaloa]